METVQIDSSVWAITAAVNMGLVATDAGLVVIDTGLDKRAGKEVATLADKLGHPVCAIINTHAHADHFGGNEYLLAKYPSATVYASEDEAAVIRRPRFEPEYLWQGAVPFAELQNKFLMANPSPVHAEFTSSALLTIGGTSFQSVPLPGHAHGQIGILVNDVFFAADAYFGAAVTDKHGIPFLVDLKATLESATRVLNTPASAYVPGHGAVTDDPQRDVQHLMDRHQDAFTHLCTIARGGVSLEKAVQGMCGHFGLSPATAGMYLLLRTSVSAYISSCIEQGIMEVTVAGGQLTFTTT